MIANLLQSARRALRRSERCNQLLGRVLPLYRLLAVHRDTQVVIEGYPRSANTFAYVAFAMAQPAPVRIAHHLHSVAQIRRGVRLGIPTIVLIREPREAILSVAIRKEHSDLQWAVDEYLDFYTAMAPLTERVVIADFHEVTGDFGAVIRRLNGRFGSAFTEFEHTDENVAACYKQIDEIEQYHTGGEAVRATHVARPSADRREQKRLLESQLEEDKLKAKVAQAEELYRSLCQPHKFASTGGRAPG
jgi:hypothetical protein